MLTSASHTSPVGLSTARPQVCGGQQGAALPTARASPAEHSGAAQAIPSRCRGFMPRT